MMTRRSLIIAIPSFYVALLSQPARTQQRFWHKHEPCPNPSEFQSGDFVWPKKPGVYVPYKSGSRETPAEEESTWQREKEIFLGNVKVEAPHFTINDIENIRRLSFREFHSRYVADEVPFKPGVFGFGGGLYVGHVAIIDIDQDGVPWVVEALGSEGVLKQTYNDWLSGRPGEEIWHGRVRDFSAEQRSAISTEANNHVDKPYNFWNFNLNDDRSFYCSKLAWMCIFRALNIPIDDNLNPRRLFWFSPKQLLYREKVVRLCEHGPYKNP